MKTIPIALANHYETNATTVAPFLQVTRADGAIFRFTSTDAEITVSGNTYEPGLDVTAIANQAGLGGNNLEITALYDDTFSRTDFLIGLWAGAEWWMFEANYRSPTDGLNVLGYYITGDTTPGEVTVKIELLSKGAARLKQNVGIVTSKECRARFADYPIPIYSARCRLDSATFLVTGTITSVTSQQVARDSARTEVEDWFGNAPFEWLTGENAGLSGTVRDYAADGTFTFSLPFPAAIGIGDEYRTLAGCRKRRDEDCYEKHDSVVNMQAEPDLPGQDAATAAPDVDL